MIESNVIKILYYVKNILQMVKIKIPFRRFNETLKEVQDDPVFVTLNLFSELHCYLINIDLIKKAL